MNKTTQLNILTPCTPSELLRACRLLQIPLLAVEQKHNQIMDMVQSGEFERKYKYHKSIYRTLIRWLQLSIERGHIQKDFAILDPDHRDKFEKLEKEAAAHGLI